jgi:hypothetical protein
VAGAASSARARGATRRSAATSARKRDIRKA